MPCGPCPALRWCAVPCCAVLSSLSHKYQVPGTGLYVSICDPHYKYSSLLASSLMSSLVFFVVIPRIFPGLNRQFGRGKPTVIGTWYTVRYRDKSQLLFPSEPIPSKSHAPIPIQIVTEKIMLFHSHPNNYRANIAMSVVSRYHSTKYRANVQSPITVP